MFRVTNASITALLAASKKSEKCLSLIAEGTYVIGPTRKDIALFLSYNMKFLTKLSFEENVDLQLLHFLEKTVNINLKLTQHTFDILYPNRPISMFLLSQRYPNFNISNPKFEVLANNDIVISVIVMQNVTKTSPLFEKGKITVFGFSYEDDKELLTNKIAIKQTGQPNPDLYYEYKEKGILKWSRYYDIKSGQFKVNCGHIVTTSCKKEFEELSEKMLKGQMSCYEQMESDVVDTLKIFAKDKTLTWGERNEKFQLFLRNNLQNYPNINPSIVVYTPLSYDMTEQKNNLQFKDAISDVACYSDIVTSQNTVAKFLSKGGLATLEKYKQVPGHCPNVAKILQEMVNEMLNHTN